MNNITFSFNFKIHRMKNTELEWNIIIERTLSSDLLSYTHSLFLNQKLKHNRNTKKEKKETHRQINYGWILTIWRKLKILVHMNRSVKQIGKTVSECILKDMWM